MDMSIKSMTHIPQLAGLTQWFISTPVMLMKKAFYSQTLSGLKKLSPTWSINTMRKGVQRLVDLSDAGVTLAHDIYTDSEIKTEPDKAGTKLFYMPAIEGAPFVIVCAGGAYFGVCSICEGFPVAAKLNELGYNAFVLSYRVGCEKLLPKPVEDLAAALKYILKNAAVFCVSTDNYAVAGFSAGGHLAGLWGLENTGFRKYDLPKPSALFLCYPATNLDTFDKNNKITRAFMNTMLGKKHTQADKDSVNIVKRMTSAYPPAYLWQCEDDDTVPVAGSLSCAQRLKELGIPHVFRIFQTGGHGIGLGEGTDAEGWLEDAVEFWQKN